MQDQLVRHTLPPIYDAGSRVLLLGSMPSPKSREVGFYYGHPQNRFWRVLAALFLEPAPEGNEARTAFLHRHGIALFDVLASCRIQGASDTSIKDPVANDLTPILQAADIGAIFCTGGKAHSLYRRYCQPVTGRTALLLPSTSPANCQKRFEDLVAAYGAILAYL